MLTRFPVVTISREFGSGGREIGRLLAEKLGVSFYDYESIASVAAEKSGYAKKIYENADEQSANPILRNMSLLGTGRNLVMNANDTLYQTQEGIIKATADHEPAVIVGRCADYVLKDYTKTVNIFICAEEGRKIRWVEKHKNVPREKAIEMIRTIDRRRATYYNYYTEQKWGNIINYDLCIKITDQEPEKIAELLYQFVMASLGDELEKAKEGYGRP